MERLLTFEEQNYLKAALEFYRKFGPGETLVADYSGSYPNNPEKAIVYGRKSWVPEIISVFDNGPEYDEDIQGPILGRHKPAADYYVMLKAYLDEQHGDMWDTLALIQALNRYTSELAFELRENLHEKEG